MTDRRDSLRKGLEAQLNRCISHPVQIGKIKETSEESLAKEFFVPQNWRSVTQMWKEKCQKTEQFLTDLLTNLNDLKGSSEGQWFGKQKGKMNEIRVSRLSMKNFEVLFIFFYKPYMVQWKPFIVLGGPQYILSFKIAWRTSSGSIKSSPQPQFFSSTPRLSK